MGEENQRFAQWVSALPYDPASLGQILLPVSIMQFQTLETFCRHVFPRSQLEQAHEDPLFFRNHAILSICNDTVASLNDHILEQMYSDLQTYHSMDTANVNDEFEGYDELLVEYLHSLNPVGLLPDCV